MYNVNVQFCLLCVDCPSTQTCTDMQTVCKHTKKKSIRDAYTHTPLPHTHVHMRRCVCVRARANTHTHTNIHTMARWKRCRKGPTMFHDGATPSVHCAVAACSHADTTRMFGRMIDQNHACVSSMQVFYVRLYMIHAAVE